MEMIFTHFTFEVSLITKYFDLVNKKLSDQYEECEHLAISFQPSGDFSVLHLRLLPHNVFNKMA